MTDQFPPGSPPGGQYPPQYQPYPGWQPQPPRKRKHIVRNVLLSIVGVFVLLIVIGIAAGSGSKNNNNNNTQASTASQAPVVGNTSSAPASPATPALYTEAQQQAIDAAAGYISDGQGFSKAGLIQQLDSPDGDGFSKKLATFAVDHIKVNWWQQAVIAAKGYMADGEGFSYEGLVQQLSSTDGDSFTTAQAEYGAKKAGL